MKKLGNLSLLALLAMGFALVFGGCRRDITAFGSPVTGVTIIDLDPDSGIPVGGTKQLFANVLPDNAINKDVTWRSENPDVATVDQNGKVTGVAGGQATITVVTDDGGFTASWVVNVKDNQGDFNPPGGGDDPDDNDNVITIFDPLKYDGDEGEVVYRFGAYYLEITPDKYDTYVPISVDLSGKTTIKCIVFGKEENANAQAVVQLVDASWADENKIPLTLKPITTTPTEVEVGEVKKYLTIQPFTQSTADWSALSGITIYIGKITAVGNGDITGPGGGDIENPSEPDEENEDTGIFIGGQRYRFADLPITADYGDSSRIVINSDGTLTVRAGGWEQFRQFHISLPKAINISGKKIAVTAKVANGYLPGLFKLIFAENDDKQSEIAGYGENAGWCDPLTTEFETYIGSNPLIAYGAVEAADLTNITKIIIDPQAGEGEITIQSIAFVEGDGNEGNPGDSGTSSGGDAETNKKIMSLDDLNDGWSAEYDAKTKTITLTGNYGAKGWGYYNGNLDVSGYSKFSVVFDKVESADPWVQVVVKYSAEDGDDTSADGKFENGQFSNGSNILTVELEKTSVLQLNIQGKNSGDKITIKEAYFE